MHADGEQQGACRVRLKSKLAASSPKWIVPKLLNCRLDLIDSENEAF